VGGRVREADDIYSHDLSPVRRRLGALRVAFRYFVKRMGHNSILETAAALSFSAVFALIPAIALLMAAVAAYPGLSALRARMEQFFIANLMPDTGFQVGVAIAGFVKAAGQLTVFGVVGLIGAALILLISIESAFNKIFHVTRPRRILVRLLVFWALMTIGPLFLGVGFSLFGIFAALPLFGGARETSNLDLLLGVLTPAFMSWLVLTFLYFIVPNRRVMLRDAMLGALVATVLLTLLRYTFTFYVLTMTTYQAIYGALAAFPVFLVWIFLVWIIVLVGAVVAAGLPDWRHESSGVVVGPAGRLMAAVAILERLQEAAREGHGIVTVKLARAVGVPDMTFASVLADLRLSRFVVQTETGEWMLARDLDRASLSDLVDAFGFGLGFGLGLDEAAQRHRSPTARRLANVLRESAESERRALSLTLGRLMQPERDDGK